MMLATNATALSATSASRAFGNGRARAPPLALYPNQPIHRPRTRDTSSRTLFGPVVD
jgi:hypothetical protein